MICQKRKQPAFLSKGGRYVISFNGEIYNHIELREEIKLQRKFCPIG